MKTKPLIDIPERAEDRPSHVQDELAAFARELDAGVNGMKYEPTSEELAGIARGVRDAEAGRLASNAQVDAAFGKFRGQ